MGRGLGGGDTIYLRCNNVSDHELVGVFVHEMGHIFGARDTYEPGSWVCEYPKGYPEPNKTPLYPQSRACLMCKFIVVDEKTFVASRSFSELTTCDEEAKAFGWK